MEMYDRLIFDFDGTIADSREIVDELLGALILEHRLNRITVKEIKHKSDLSVIQKIKLLIFIRKVDSEFKELYHENIERIYPVDGIIDVLKRLDQKGIRLSILSSNTKSNIEAFLCLHGISFITDIISVEGLFGKHKAIRKACSASEKVLYIGDEIRDIKACNKAKVDIAFVKWGLDGDEDIGGLKTRYIVNEPQELLNLVC